MPRNLIIATIGDGSVHRTWLEGAAQRDFDLFLIYYGSREGQAREDATHYLQRKGMKWELLDHVARECADTLQPYDYYWCPDDDVALDAASVNEMFALARRFNLQLAQPAIARGEISHQSLRQRPGNLLRYSPFIEVMCPLFSREAFFKLSFTFLHSISAWGLDLVWSKYIEPGTTAILDKIPAHHTRPRFTGEAYRRFRERGINPRKEMWAVVARHGGIDRWLYTRYSRGWLSMPAVPDPDAVSNPGRRRWGKLFGRAA